ncbi:MAG: P-II family nitrogen regulator [Tissierellia bacterium]|nr:P-II family nitrogen regulator [Tissierellia bacterium]MDD4047078.1 P-II family nitrogen regulator [Tissierellia bacterium]MDD4678781.1 P-II family nitrogen regulator [Tissierellia bacterium]
MGKGTMQSNKLLDILGLNEAQKEILMIATTEEMCSDLQDKLSEHFLFSKKNKGIAFSIPFVRWKLKTNEEEKREIRREFNPSHFCIMTIVDKGKSKDCIKAAKAAGARGGTIMHGHGAGVPTDYYFPLIIEPQKDIVMILTAKDNVAAIKDRIIADLELYKEGKGVIFALPVSKISGLIENKEVRA